eukprot:10765574-Ditylum_brightwellii.AAC.1
MLRVVHVSRQVRVERVNDKNNEEEAAIRNYATANSAKTAADSDNFLPDNLLSDNQDNEEDENDNEAAVRNYATANSDKTEADNGNFLPNSHNNQLNNNMHDTAPTNLASPTHEQVSMTKDDNLVE